MDSIFNSDRLLIDYLFKKIDRSEWIIDLIMTAYCDACTNKMRITSYFNEEYDSMCNMKHFHLPPQSELECTWEGTLLLGEG